MKKIFLVLLICLAGCASAQIPSYIQAEHPYKKIVYGQFDEVVGAVKDVLSQEGWTIIKETHPAIYERNASYTEQDKEHLLLFTQAKKSTRLVYANFSHLNVYIHKTQEGIELDLRYGGVTDLHIKKIHHYRNDKMINRLIGRIEQRLLQK